MKIKIDHATETMLRHPMPRPCNRRPRTSQQLRRCHHRHPRRRPLWLPVTLPTEPSDQAGPVQGSRRVQGVGRPLHLRCRRPPLHFSNDEGLCYVEASSEQPLGSILDEPSPDHLYLHPPLDALDVLAQVQLTRFACGSLVVAFTCHHMVADGLATSGFIVAWGRATRGLSMEPLPLHDRSIFVPRDPPRFYSRHHGVEYVDRRTSTKRSDPSQDDAIVVHKARFPLDFVAKLKSEASVDNPYAKPFTTFECLMAHLWRKITRARGLSGKETTKMRIAVNGRSRMRNPSVPTWYFGNVVL
ncbi:unnamed protein product [Victoria cruziana]